MRLTDRACIPDITGKHNEFFYIKDNQNITDEEILNKLGQYEDIEDAIGISLIDYFKGISFDINKNNQYLKLEEELGIDLITLFKALKDGIYAYDHANNIDHMKILNVFYDTKDMECKTDFDGDIFEYDFADYGKTWALTKEELL